MAEYEPVDTILALLLPPVGAAIIQQNELFYYRYRDTADRG